MPSHLKRKRTTTKRKLSPYAKYVKDHFHQYYKPGSGAAGFKKAVRAVAAAYHRSH